MRTSFFLLVISLFQFYALSAQPADDAVLMEIGSQKVSIREFERIYLKNRNVGDEVKEMPIDEYLDLFITFKLKVVQAEELGYDTLSSFIKELKGYREQLAKPYLTNQKAIDRLIEEAWERSQKDIHASHILIKGGNNLNTKEQEDLYNKVINIRERILAGESFTTVAKGTSDDPSAKFNGGDLGYFTVFQMVYPFETAAYNTPPGEISMPVKSRFGYHLIKVLDTRPSRGEIKVAHIMIATPRGSSQEETDKAGQEIIKIYEMLQQGEDFASLAKEHSDDYRSAKNGGELPWFGTGKMIPDFDKAAFALTKNGEISKPVKTPYGWHIIKRIDIRKPVSLEKSREAIERKVLSGDRIEVAKKEFIDQLKEEYSFKSDSSLLQPFYKAITDSSLASRQWMNASGLENQGTLFSFASKEYSPIDLKTYIAAQKGIKLAGTPRQIVDKLYYDFVRKEIIGFEKGRLEDKYPEFRYLLKEYHDGMLLFEISDNKVWSKASEDSTGLQKFYKAHAKDYMSEEAVQYLQFSFSTDKQEKELYKLLRKGAKKKHKLSFYRTYYPADTVPGSVKLEQKETYLPEFEYFEATDIKKGKYKKINDNEGSKLILINKLIDPRIMDIDEIRGLVTSDYQDYLKEKWEESLRKEYEVKVNNELLEELKLKIGNIKQ